MRASRAFRSVPVLLGRLLSALFAAGSIQAAKPRGFHPSEASCEGCHMQGRATTPEQAHLLLGSQETLCGRCHEGANQISHPSGFAPRRALPREYPADWKGDMTCSSCHDAHGKAQGLMRGAKRGCDLCHSGHQAQFFTKMRDPGLSMLASGHLDASSARPGAKLDHYSRECLVALATRARPATPASTATASCAMVRAR